MRRRICAGILSGRSTIVIFAKRLGMERPTRKSFIGLIELQTVMALLLFVSAGSLSFWEGWVYWVLFSIGVIAITLYFLKHDSHLIEGRLRAGPLAARPKSQKIITAMAAVWFVGVL